VKVKVLAISGSPREGNTRKLLERAVEGAIEEGAEIKKVFLSELNYSGCTECGGCDETGVCILEDDLTYFYQDLVEADAVILSAPIFFSHLSAQTKAMIDRFQAWWIAKYILNNPLARKKRPGAFICVGGQKRTDFFECAKKTVKAFFAIANISYEEELFRGGMDREDDILKDKDALKKAYDIGKKLVILAKKELKTED
jgi:multimeric flavodoxin WrbA